MSHKITLAFKPRLIAIYLYILFSFIAKPPILSEVYSSISLNIIVGLTLITIVKRGSINWNIYMTWSCIMLCYSIISSLYAENSDYVYKALPSMVTATMLTFMILQLVKNKKEVLYIVLTFAISGFILYVLMNKHNLLDVTERLGTTFYGNANSFAFLIMYSTIASLLCVMFSEKKWIWITLIIFIICDYHMLLLSEGRKYILFPIIFIILFFAKKANLKLTYITGIGIATYIILPIIGSIIAELNIFNDTLIDRFNDLSKVLSGESHMSNEGDVERNIMITKGFDFFMTSPILGNGHNNFAYLYSREWLNTGVYSHNNFIELLCNLGVFGLIIYYSLYYLLIKETLKKNNTENSIIFAFLCTTLISEMGIVSYYSNIPQQIALSLCCIAKFRSHKIS